MPNRNLKIQPIPRRLGTFSRVSDSDVQEHESTTPPPVKYELHRFSVDKIASGEIDPTFVDPYKYSEFPRSGNGQVTIDLNTDTEFNRYMINLQIDKFENTKFNEIVNIDFEEFPEPTVEDTISNAFSSLNDVIANLRGRI